MRLHSPYPALIGVAPGLLGSQGFCSGVFHRPWHCILLAHIPLVHARQVFCEIDQNEPGLIQLTLLLTSLIAAPGGRQLLQNAGTRE